jgi:hypothetical protein
MKPPVDRNAAVVATLAIALVVSICATIFLTHVDYHPHSVSVGTPADTNPATTPKQQ